MGKVFSCITLMCKKERVTHVFNIKGWFYDVLVRFKISECIMQGTERERVYDRITYVRLRSELMLIVMMLCKYFK